MNYNKKIDFACARHVVNYDVPPRKIVVPFRAMDPNYFDHVPSSYMVEYGTGLVEVPIEGGHVPDVTLFTSPRPQLQK